MSYRAYFHDDTADSYDPVGVPQDDFAAAADSARGFHARNICDSAADYVIVGPDGDTIAWLTFPASVTGALVNG